MSGRNEDSLIYPLKIIEIDDFFLNFDNMISKQAFYESTSSRTLNEPATFRFESDIPAGCDKKTNILAFIDSKNYRLNFEKSHLKLISNLVVFDR